VNASQVDESYDQKDDKAHRQGMLLERREDGFQGTDPAEMATATFKM